EAELARDREAGRVFRIDPDLDPPRSAELDPDARQRRRRLGPEAFTRPARADPAAALVALPHPPSPRPRGLPPPGPRGPSTRSRTPPPPRVYGAPSRQRPPTRRARGSR